MQNHGKISQFAVSLDGHNCHMLMELLEAFKSRSSGLTKVYIATPAYYIRRCLPLLSSFRHLTQCFFTLSWESDRHLDLSALQALPELTELGVDGGGGVCEGIETLPNLSSLRLEKVTSDCKSNSCSVSSFTKLELRSCLLMRFLDKGVSSCPQLRVLVCDLSTIGSVNKEETLISDHRSDHCQVPSSWSTLTALHTLTIKGNMPEWTWITDLAGLQHLEIETRETEFGRSFVNLTNLQSLRVCWSSTGLKGDAWVHFDFEWALLVSLRFLQLECCGLYEQIMVGLADIPSLQEVSFIRMTGYDPYTASQMAQLAYKLGQSRPDVKFVMT